MANEEKTRGGTHEQHVKAGEQSHKNAGDSTKGGGRETERANDEQSSGSSRGGTHEQHVKAGEQSHKNS